MDCVEYFDNPSLVGRKLARLHDDSPLPWRKRARQRDTVLVGPNGQRLTRDEANSRLGLHHATIDLTEEE